MTTAATLRVRLRAVTAEQAFGFLPWSMCIAGALSLALIAVHSVLQQRTDISQGALAWTLALLLPAAVLAFAPTAPFEWSRRADRIGVTSWALALNAGILLLFVPVYAAVWQTDWDAMTGWRIYAFFNKRWLAALYGVALMTTLVLPVWIDRWSRDLPVLKAEGHQPTARKHPWWAVAIECALLLGVVWYLFGPPWNIATHHRPIDFHEQVHLGPLQAIDKGFLPYVGPASTQYGPGAQMLIYAYMALSGQFNLVGFREAFLVIHLISVAIFALLARAHGGWKWAVPIVVIGAICSPMKFFVFTSDGSPGESFGWGNAGRYLAPLVIVPAIGILLTREVRRVSAAGLALGVAWGLLAWFAQENLVSVMTGTLLLVLVLVGTGAATWRRAREVALPIVAGLALVWVPLIGWYGWHGSAIQFVYNYLVLPRAVAAGFQNTWFIEGPGDPMARAYYLTPLVVIVAGVLATWDLRQWRVRPLDRDQIRLLSFVCVLAASYQGALYRSDSLHTLNVLLALPFVLVLAFRDLASWHSATLPGRAAFHAAVVVVALSVYPLQPQLTQLYDWVFYPPVYKYRVVATPAPATPEGIAFQRASARLIDEPSVAGAGTGGMREFLADASALHDLVGERRTFVEAAAPYFTGIVYFMADLTPAPYLYDVETLVFNDRQEAQARAHFQGNIDQVECVIVSSPDRFEARAFLAANPSARVLPRRLGEASLFVIMNGG